MMTPKRNGAATGYPRSGAVFETKCRGVFYGAGDLKTGVARIQNRAE